MFSINRKKENEVIHPMYHGEIGGMEYLSFPAIAQTGVAAAYYSTRIGGASRGDFGTVNFSFKRGDEAESVLENYRRMAKVINEDSGSLVQITNDSFVVASQTHTTNIRVVTETDRGKGVTRERDYADVDGLITNVPGVVLTTFHADCVPIYIVDPTHRAIGLAHSGWKGTVGKIAINTLSMMRDYYGTDARECTCAIGPSICADCYEIGEDVAEKIRVGFNATHYDPSKILYPGMGSKYQLDLWEACRQTLVYSGVPKENITVTDICTKCNDEFVFSHRTAGNKRGTNAAFLCIV